MSSVRYEFIMSQIKHIRDIKENEKIKISFVFYEGCQGPCIFKICKNRNLSEVYQALMEVRHPNLAVVYDCIYENGNTYVVEEYIPGKTLAELLKEKGTFTEEETSQIMVELCEGLEVLHRQEPPIIHNDIKTSNIMIREDGLVKLFDFDISRTYKEGSYKNTKLMGTYEYAAPEHYGFGQSEPCTDIYSLGVTMHEMLTGVGLDHEHNVTYQGGMAKIIQKCVEIDRKKRYASAALLKEDLEKCQKPTGRIVGIVAVSVCVFLVLAIGGMLFSDYLTSRKTPQNPTEGVYSEEEFETGDEDTEGNTGTEEIENTEDDAIQEEVTEEEENSGTVGSTQGSAEGDTGSSGAGNNAGTNNDVVNSETESGESSIPKKAMKIVCNIQDTFLAMDAWNDGTFLWMEEISGNYYLRSSDGKETLLEGVKAPQGAQLECNPYTNQMYLVAFDYNGEKLVYSVNGNLEVKFITDYDNRADAFVAFFSDGTMIYGAERLNSKDWSYIYRYDRIYAPKIIKDKLYSFEFVDVDSKLEYFFLERDEEWNVVREFSLKDEGIGFGGYFEHGSVYNNSKAVYFTGSKDYKTYLFCFDGEKFIPMICLSDYENFHGACEEICVTDTALRYYDNWSKAIVECTFE